MAEWNILFTTGRHVIESVLIEGVKAGKEDGDIPDWKIKDAQFHASRAHAHLEQWLWGKDKNDTERHLEHAMTRCLMALIRSKDGNL